jgi:hypothetical protein
MVRRRIKLLTSIVVGAIPLASLGADHLPVFIFAGQSNMVGFQTNSDQLTAAQKASQSNVLYAQRQALPVSWLNMSAPTEVNTPGQWPVNSGHGFGPELTAPMTISNAHTSRTVAAVKFAVNATDLNGDWNVNNVNGLYPQMLARVNDALTKLPQQQGGTTGYVAGFFWMQGESDAGVASWASNYQTNLTNLIARVRQDFGDPDLPFVLGQINNAGAFTNTVRTAQSNVAASVLFTALTLTDDLPRVPGDTVHFTTQGTYDLGIRFGQSFNSLVSNPRWSGLGADWNSGASWVGLIPNHLGAIANFGSTATAAQTIANNSAVKVGMLRFDNANAHSIGGVGSITIDVAAGAGSIVVVNGAHQINQAVRLNDSTNVDVAAGKVLTLSSPLTAAGGAGLTKLGSGKLVINNIRAAALNANAGAIELTAATVSVVSSLGIQNGAQVDLTDNSMIIDYAGGSPIDTIRQYLAADKLTSTASEADTRLAYAEASALGITQFKGESVDGTSLVIALALPGDLNLDGAVDITDLGALATNWQSAGVWTSGDLDYSGFVDITDLGLLATNWQQSGMLGDAIEAAGLPPASVPEPVVLPLLVLAVMRLRYRR